MSNWVQVFFIKAIWNVCAYKIINVLLQYIIIILLFIEIPFSIFNRETKHPCRNVVKKNIYGVSVETKSRVKYVVQNYTCHSWRSPVRTRSSVRREIQNSYVSGFQSAKSSHRKEARPRWLKYGGLPHSDRSIFHEDMTKERCRMTLRWISVNQSLSRYKRSSSDFMKSYVLLRYFVRIDRSPTVPSYSRE